MFLHKMFIISIYIINFKLTRIQINVPDIVLIILYLNLEIFYDDSNKVFKHLIKILYSLIIVKFEMFINSCGDQSG